jgi:two-component system response regulator NreC
MTVSLGYGDRNGSRHAVSWADADSTAAPERQAPADSITIVLADDHSLVRSALRMLLEAEPDLEVVAEAGNASDAVRYCLGHKPDVVVVDLNMPGGPVLEAIPSLREASPDTRVVVLTVDDDPASIREAMRAGALGYVLKSAAGAGLVQAIRMVAEGETYLEPQLGARLAAEPSRLPYELSERELEIVRLIALGHTNREIADQLYLSIRTVESHRAYVRRKLGLRTRSELVLYALERGMLAS